MSLTILESKNLPSGELQLVVESEQYADVDIDGQTGQSVELRKIVMGHAASRGMREAGINKYSAPYIVDPEGRGSDDMKKMAEIATMSGHKYRADITLSSGAVF